MTNGVYTRIVLMFSLFISTPAFATTLERQVKSEAVWLAERDPTAFASFVITTITTAYTSFSVHTSEIVKTVLPITTVLPVTQTITLTYTTSNGINVTTTTTSVQTVTRKVAPVSSKARVDPPSASNSLHYGGMTQAEKGLIGCIVGVIVILALILGIIWYQWYLYRRSWDLLDHEMDSVVSESHSEIERSRSPVRVVRLPVWSANGRPPPPAPMPPDSGRNRPEDIPRPRHENNARNRSLSAAVESPNTRARALSAVHEAITTRVNGVLDDIGLPHDHDTPTDTGSGHDPSQADDDRRQDRSAAPSPPDHSQTQGHHVTTDAGATDSTSAQSEASTLRAVNGERGIAGSDSAEGSAETSPSVETPSPPVNRPSQPSASAQRLATGSVPTVRPDDHVVQQSPAASAATDMLRNDLGQMNGRGQT